MNGFGSTIVSLKDYYDSTNKERTNTISPVLEIWELGVLPVFEFTYNQDYAFIPLKIGLFFIITFFFFYKGKSVLEVVAVEMLKK